MKPYRDYNVSFTYRKLGWVKHETLSVRAEHSFDAVYFAIQRIQKITGRTGVTLDDIHVELADDPKGGGTK